MRIEGPQERDEELRRVLEAGIRAPSGDNCQPWHFRIPDSNTIEIYTVAERAKSFFDYGLRGTLISVGAVVENMRIQALADGWSIEVSYPEDEIDEGPQSVVRLAPSAQGMRNPAQVTAMLDRTVNRRPFLPMRPARKKLDAILGKAVQGVEVTVIDRRRDIRRWARLIYLADRIRYTHPVIHEELFSKILFSREQAGERRMGLEIDRLGAGPAAVSIMQFLRPWERMVRLQRYGIDRALASQSRLLALASGVLVLVSIADDTPRGWMRAGESVERLWIGAQEQGLCVHPMTVVLFLNRRYREEGMSGFLARHRPWLEEIDENLKELLGDRTGTILFRLGTGWQMKDTAVRMPLETFIN